MGKRLMTFFACLFLSLGMALAQTQISGSVVSSEDGEPVIGASVLVVGTKTGTVTDVDGNFSLSVPAGSKLKIQYIGMKASVVNAKNNLKVILEPDAKSIEEVIVTGYGNYKKSSFTGAASTMNTKSLEDVPVMSFTDKLAGGVSGVTVTSSSSSPGAVAQIRVRGMGSINASNNPLIVIDGTPVSSTNMTEFSYSDAGTSILATLNSNDIESMTVIKDAAAASLYGSRAANGVIVIKTKSGSKGKTRVGFRSDWGFSNMAIDYRPQLSGSDRRALLQKGLENYYQYEVGQSATEAAASAAAEIDDYAAEPETGWTNWKDYIFKTGHHSNYMVDLQGGNDKTQFYTSLAYAKQEGIVPNQSLDRYTGNINLTHSFGRFTLNWNSLLSKMEQSVADESTSYDGAIANYAFFQNPSSYPYNADGSYATNQGFAGVNPLHEWKHQSDKNNVLRTFNSIRLNWNIWDNLNLSEKITYDNTNGEEDVLWDRESHNGSPSGVFQRIKNTNEQINTQTQLTYNKKFGLHGLDVLLGFETEDSKYSYNYMSGQDYPGDLYELGNAGTTSAESQKYRAKMVSYLGRVNYTYNDLYYLSASFRRDGSSRFAKDSRWGNFWSVSGSWRFTGEKFFDNLKNVLSDGRLRISYGTNGTLPTNYYGYMSIYKYGEYYNGESGMGIVGVGNPDLKWEKNKAFNIGLDLTFLNKYTATFDWYNRTTSDLIYNMPISAVPGYYDSSYNATTPMNIGSLRNTGWELTLNANWYNKKDFSWSTSVNIAHNHNKVIKLNGSTDVIMDNTYSRVLAHKVGETYNSYYAYEYAGVDPETGNELYYINDGSENARNTTTDATKAQKVIIGSAEASIEGGISNTIKYKDFDFNMNFTYQIGGDAYDYPRWQHTNGGDALYQGAVPSYYDLSKMWTGPGDTSCSLPKFQYGSSFVYSSRWMMPLDYLRLKSMSLGYSLPRELVSRLSLSKARVYFSASNLFTIKSSDLYVDPEVPTNGIANFETPAMRTFTFGIELGF